MIRTRNRSNWNKSNSLPAWWRPARPAAWRRSSGHNEAQLSGQVRYDLERLCGLLRPYLGPAVRLTGQGASDAWYRGPLAASEALSTGQAEAGVRWDQADLGGFPLGRGELKADMANGAVQMTPLELTVSQGQVHLAPRLRLRPEPLELSLPAGPLAEQIAIDPAMCTSMLKYAAPGAGQRGHGPRHVLGHPR